MELNSNLLDPLINDFSVSLIPRIVNSRASLCNPNSSILDSLLQARVSSSPDKLLKLGKSILEGGIDDLEADKAKVIHKQNENVRKEKRPGLGIPQAKFTMRPMPSQTAENLEPNIDFSKSDPAEFFADVEKREKVKREMRRLNGQPLYDFDPDQPVVRRPRRPSILGTTATYKPRSYSEFSSTTEISDNDVLSPTHSNVSKEANNNNDSPGVKVSDSKSVTTNEGTTLADLLPLVEGLDEEEVQKLLQEKLKIKDVDIDNFVLPEWRVPFPDSVFNPSSALKSARSIKQNSPAKRKSPLASISLLNRHIAKRTPLRDPFSTVHFDSSPVDAIDPSIEPERMVDLVGKSIEVDARSKSSRYPAHGAAYVGTFGEDAFVSVENDIGPVSEPKEKEGVVGHVDEIGIGSDSLGAENVGTFDEDAFVSVENDIGPICEPKEKEGVVGHDEIGIGVDSHEIENPLVNEENIGASGEDLLFSESMAVGPISVHEIQEDEVAETQLPVRQINFEGLDVENPSSCGGGSGRHESSITGDIPVKEPAKEVTRSSKRRIEQEGKSKSPSKETMNEGVETITSGSDALVNKERIKKRKLNGGQQRRFSLYDAGTKWEAGVRRSSRIRMRPLQFWKGERFLYGRVNESLVTVIGVKYASPSKDTVEPELKVKSFVSNKDEDLLKFYSLY